MFIKLIFVVIPLTILAGLIGLTYWGITTFLSITGPIEQTIEEVSMPSVMQGKVFIPKLIRNNSTPLWVEVEISDLDRNIQESHKYEVNITDDCDYIEIEDGYQELLFDEQGKSKETIKVPISIRNIKPPIQCKVQVQITHPNLSQVNISKFIPIDAWTTKILSGASALLGLLTILFSIKILK